MKYNSVKFVPSITVNRDGQQMPAHKVGLFRLDRLFLTYTATCTCRSGVVMAPESRLERAVIDSGKGKSLSVCLTNVNRSHVPHRSFYTARPGQDRPDQRRNPAAQPRRFEAIFPPPILPLIC